MNHNDDPGHPPNGSFRDHSAAEPWVIEGDQQLGGSFSGAVDVPEGACFTIAHYGPLTLHPGSTGHLVGEHLGPLHVAEGARLEVESLQNGPTEVAAGAVVKIAAPGRLAGSSRVAGVIENHGVRAGNTVLAGGEVHDIDGGGIEPPVITGAETLPGS